MKTLAQHMFAIQSQFPLPKEYAITPEEWSHLREELIEWLRRHGVPPYPIAADISRVNYLLCGVPVVLKVE